MKHIDMHCDSLSMLVWKDRENANLYDVDRISVDIKKMKKGGQAAQFFAVFLPPSEVLDMIGLSEMSDDEYIRMLRGYLLKNVKEHSDIIAMAYNADDIEKNIATGKMSAVLTMEDGRAVNGSLEKLDEFYQLGFRAVTLTWNKHNCFGAPNSAEPGMMKEGLTDFGKEAVAYMQELGILVDVSHLSEGGFYDVADICKKPFAATHSNCASLSLNPRNLTDAQLKILGETGSVAGLNFGPEFLNKDISCKDSTAGLIAKHARHMADMGGIDCVAIGSDFDGIDGNLEISDCSKLELLEYALKKERFTSEEIEKIFYKNVMRMLKESVK